MACDLARSQGAATLLRRAEESLRAMTAETERPLRRSEAEKDERGMSDFGPALSDDQWNRIRQIVHDEALRARVAASFLPLYGPLPGDATTVPEDSLSYRTRLQGTLAVNDFDTIRLATVAVNVNVRNHMLADPELAAASIMFRRAANIVARVEDAIIFAARRTRPLNLRTSQAPRVCPRFSRLAEPRATKVSLSAPKTA